MIEDVIAQAGLGGIALYLMFRLSQTVQIDIKKTIDENTAAIITLIDLIEKWREEKQ